MSDVKEEEGVEEKKEEKTEEENEEERKTKLTKFRLNEIFNEFIESIFKMIPSASRRTKQGLTKEEVMTCFQELMKVHGTIDEWDDTQFD